MYNFTCSIVYIEYSALMVDVRQQIKAIRQLNAMKTFIGFSLALAIAIGYMVWLDAGCERVGVMTWSGKVCYENL